MPRGARAGRACAAIREWTDSDNKRRSTWSAGAYINSAVRASPMRSAWSAWRGSSSRTRIRVSASCCRPAAASPTRCSIWSPRPSAGSDRRRAHRSSCAAAIRSSPTRCSKATARTRIPGEARAGLPRHRRHPADGAADPLGVADGARPDRRLRRDLVDAPVRCLSAPSRQASRQGALDRRARRRVGRMGPARPGGALGGVAGEHRRAYVRRDAATLIITGFIARDAQGPADDARPQRQRLLRLDLRRACSTPRRSTSGPTSTAC